MTYMTELGVNTTTRSDLSPAADGADRGGACPICGSPRVRVVRVREGFPIQECRDCRSLSAKLTRSQLPSYDAHYEDASHYGGYVTMAATAQTGNDVLYWYQQRMIDEAGPGNGRLHIDIGSGLGTFLTVTRKHGWESLGVDISPVAAAQAKANFGIDTFVGDLLDLPQPAGSVGWVSAFEVIEHVFDPRACVRFIHQLLMPGGLVTVSVPNGRSRQEKYTHDPILTPPTHVNYFSQAGLRQLFESEGFATTYDYVKPIAWGELKMPKWAKVAMLPVLALDRVFLGHAGNRLLWVGRKAG